MSIWPAAVLK